MNFDEMSIFELVSLRDKLENVISKRIQNENEEVNVMFIEGKESNNFYKVSFEVYGLNGEMKRLKNKTKTNEQVLINGAQSTWIKHEGKVKDGTVIMIKQDGVNKWGNMVNAAMGKKNKRYFIIDRSAEEITEKGFGRSMIKGKMKEIDNLSEEDISRIVSLKNNLEDRWKKKTL